MLTITISFYTSLKEDSNGVFKAMWENIVMSDFTTTIIHRHHKKEEQYWIFREI